MRKGKERNLLTPRYTSNGHLVLRLGLKLLEALLLGAKGTALFFLVPGCAIFNTGGAFDTLVTTCNIPTDQSSTISGRWKNYPIPIAFHQGDFSSSELTSMVNALNTWNTFFKASKGFNIYDYGSESSPRMSTTSDPSQSGTLCATGIIQNTQFVGNFVIYKLGTWPSAYSTNAIALTSFCTVQGSPYPYLYMGVMEINYQNFFVSGTKSPDLQSIVLHELGHGLGEKHSCEVGSTALGMPNCSSDSLDASYISAVMFPIFSFDSAGNGQQKRSLGTNDQSRANCLY